MLSCPHCHAANRLGRQACWNCWTLLVPSAPAAEPSRAVEPARDLDLAPNPVEIPPDAIPDTLPTQEIVDDPPAAAPPEFDVAIPEVAAAGEEAPPVHDTPPMIEADPVPAAPPVGEETAPPTVAADEIADIAPPEAAPEEAPEETIEEALDALPAAIVEQPDDADTILPETKPEVSTEEEPPEDGGVAGEPFPLAEPEEPDGTGLAIDLLAGPPLSAAEQAIPAVAEPAVAAERGGLRWLMIVTIALAVLLLAAALVWLSTFRPRPRVVAPAETARQYLAALVAGDVTAQQQLATEESRAHPPPGWFIVAFGTIAGPAKVKGKLVTVPVTLNLMPAESSTRIPAAVQGVLVEPYDVTLKLHREAEGWRVDQRAMTRGLLTTMRTRHPGVVLPTK